MAPSTPAAPLPLALKRRHCELADALEEIAEQPLSFRGPYANGHSAKNHRHLWMLEYAADRDAQITTAVREAAVRYILGRWRARLPAHATASPKGFRLYCYEDVAPTVSVVGETGEGCPYGGGLIHVKTLREVLEPYAKRPWSQVFGKLAVDGDAILKALSAHEGSLSQSAKALGLPVAEIRRRIEWWGLGPDVNRLRKHHNRRPAQFRDENHLPMNMRIYEERVQPFP